MTLLCKNLIYVYFFLATILLYAQSPVSIHLTEKDGLPDIQFYDILEDKQGYVWLAADKGLYRYDGVEFKNYTHPKKKGLSVFGLKLDAKGRVWCNNVSGQFFYTENDNLRLFETKKNDLESFTRLRPFQIYKNNLVVTGFKEMYLFNLDTRKKQELKGEDESVLEGAFIINDTLFSATKKYIKYLTCSTNELNSYNVEYLDIRNMDGEGKSFFLFKNKFFMEKRGRSGKFIGESNFYIKNNTKFRNVKTPKELLSKRIITKDVINNLLWITTNKGVYVYDFIEGEFRFKNSYFTTNSITKVLKDKNENYWFTTLHNGVYVIPNIYLKQYATPKNASDITALETIIIDEFFYGTTNGKVVRFSITDNTFKVTSLATEFPVRAICNNTFNTNIYISTDDSSYLYDKETTRIEEKGSVADKDGFFEGFSNTKSFSLLDISRVLKVSHNAVEILHIEDEKIIKKEEIGYKGRSYVTHYNPKTKNSYVGRVDDFICFDKELKPSTIQHNNNSIFAIDITETSDGVIWVSTFSDGLLAIKNNKVIANYTTENGLLSNQTNTIKGDGTNLWVTTNKGIQRLNTITKRFKNLTKRDGIVSYNITDIQVSGEHVFFTSNKGLFSVAKNKVFKNRISPVPYFTKVIISDVETAVQSSYNLEYNQNKIKIAFNTTGFQSKANVKYQYKLLGYDTTWQNVTLGNNEVLFNSLPEGDYIFQLKALNEKTESAIKELRFVISGVFYKQWWFYVLMSLALVLLSWRYFRLKNKRLKENQELVLDKQAKELENTFLRLESLRSQMNPHFIFNALNSIQDYIIQNEQKLARKYLVKFSRLIRIYLEHSQIDEISLQEEIDALQLYLALEKDRFEDSFLYSINLSNNLKTSQIQMSTFLIQPYVENAIVHGLLHKKENRELNISFKLNKENTLLECSIEDNGIGREASAKINSKRNKPKSFSSEANKKRLNLLNKVQTSPIVIITTDKYSENGEAEGTKVFIEIPLKGTNNDELLLRNKRNKN